MDKAVCVSHAHSCSRAVSRAWQSGAGSHESERLRQQKHTSCRLAATLDLSTYQLGPSSLPPVKHLRRREPVDRISAVLAEYGFRSGLPPLRCATAPDIGAG